MPSNGAMNTVHKSFRGNHRLYFSKIFFSPDSETDNQFGIFVVLSLLALGWPERPGVSAHEKNREEWERGRFLDGLQQTLRFEWGQINVSQTRKGNGESTDLPAPKYSCTEVCRSLALINFSNS